MAEPRASSRTPSFILASAAAALICTYAVTRSFDARRPLTGKLIIALFVCTP